MSAASTMKKAAEHTKAQRTKHDWSRVEAMTAAERHAAALADPDAQPLTAEDFAAQFHIPIGTLRDWEQGRKEPDAAAKAYLRVIASEPETVRKALLPRPRPVVMKRKREARDVARR